MGEITVLNGEEEICERKEDEAGHCIMREEMGKMRCVTKSKERKVMGSSPVRKEIKEKVKKEKEVEVRIKKS